MAPVGYATLVNTAETAWQQGVDLYGEEQDRLIAGTQVIIQRYLFVDLHLYATRYSSTAFAFKYPKVGRYWRAHLVDYAGAEFHASLLLAEPEQYRQPIPEDVCGGKVKGNNPVPPGTKPGGT